MLFRSGKVATLDEVRQKLFMGHPVGLWALFTTEMWERFCYYGMRSLLILYLISTLTGVNPGFGWSEESANELYGWFTGLVYLFPLLGGYLADRFLGQHRSILLGGILMAIGEFCLFYSEYFRQHAVETVTYQNAPAAFSCFMLGLFLITLGNGFFKPCISVMVGDLYEKHDPRRESAFYIFYMGINVGAFAAPFVAGTVGEKISWHWGFLTACIGMCLGLCVYSFLRPKFLGPIGLKVRSTETSEEKNATEVPESIPNQAPTKLSRVEIDRIAVILTLTFFCIAFWSVFEQAGTSLNIFANKETNRQVPSSIGSKLPGFIPNQADLDAKIAKRALDRSLYELDSCVQKFANELDSAQDVSLREALWPALVSKDFSGAMDVISAYPFSEKENADKIVALVNNLEKSYSTSLSFKEHANAARAHAGLDELALDVEDFDTALEEGKNEDVAVQKEVEERLAQMMEQSGNADVNVDALRLSLQNDVISMRQNQFLLAEQSKIDDPDDPDPKGVIYTFPTTWYQSVNPLSVVLLAPLFGIMWSFLRRRGLEPSTPVKFGIGLILLSIAFSILIPGAIQAQETRAHASAYWLLGTYVLCTLGELCISPVGLSMVSRLAPQRYASLLMGIWFLSSAIAGYLSGKLAAVFGSSDGESGRVAFFFGEKGGLADFFLIMTLVPLVAGLIVFLLSPQLRKMMHEDESATNA